MAYVSFTYTTRKVLLKNIYEVYALCNITEIVSHFPADWYLEKEKEMILESARNDN
jgi:hypothetical protein